MNFIKDYNEEIYKKSFLPFIKIIIFVRSVYFWILSILLFPIFLIGMDVDYKVKKSKYFKKYLEFYN